MTIFNNIVTVNRIRALAEDKGLQLVLRDEPIACTSGTTIYLQRPSWDATDEELTMLEGNTYHEIGHCAPRNKDVFDLIKDKKISMESRLGAALNALDDVRQEDEQLGKYAGRDRVMGDSNKLCTDKQIEKGAFSHTHTDDGIKFHQNCLGYMTYKFADMYPACAGGPSRIDRTLSPEVRDSLNMLKAHDSEIDPRGENAEGVYKKALRLLELLGFDPEQEEKDAQDKKAAEEQLSDAAKAFAEEMYKHHHTDKEVAEHGEVVDADDGEKRNHYMDSTDRSGGDYMPSDWNAMFIHDYAKQPSHDSPSEYIEQMVDESSFLGTRVKKLLQAQSQTRYTHGHKRGKISGKNLYRATMEDSGSYQEKVFKKKEHSLSTDLVVSLVVDCSGSMGDCSFKYGHAAASAIVMNEVLTQIGIDCEVVGFTESRKHYEPVLRHAIFKSFGKRTSKEQLNSNFVAFEKYTEQNLDGESIMWAAKRLLTRKAGRRIMIVFSDGQPAAHRAGAVEITHKVIKELEARKDMEIYGIGIHSKSVQEYYKDYAVIKPSESLEQAILDVIKLKIINGDQT